MPRRTQHTPLSLMEADCLSLCHAEQLGTEGHQEKGPLSCLVLSGGCHSPPFLNPAAPTKGCSPGQGTQMRPGGPGAARRQLGLRSSGQGSLRVHPEGYWAQLPVPFFKRSGKC